MASASTLADEADKPNLQAVFVREDWTMFRALGTLTQRAGVSASWLRRLVAKELVDNALDEAGACEVGTLPGGGIFVEDNGPGIDPGVLAEMFSIRRPLLSSKLKRLPTRGALGNGLRVVVGAVLASGGTLTIWTRDQRVNLIPGDDGFTTAVTSPAVCPSGARVEVHLGNSVPEDADELAWARTAIEVAARGSSYKGKPSPHWFDADAFFELTQAAIGVSVRQLVESLDGCTGRKAGEVAGGLLGRPAVTLARAEAMDVLARAREQARPVNPERLGHVGPLLSLGDGYARERGTIEVAPGRDGMNAALPFVIEAWASVADVDSLVVCVNRSPVAAEVTTHRGQKRKLAIFGCGLEHYVDVGQKSMRLTLNIISPYMPITSDGKTPDLVRYLAPLQSAIKKAAAAAKRTSRPTAGDEPISLKLAILASLSAAVRQAGGDGAYRFSQRQLYYAVRPLVEWHTSDPDYDYFCQVITDHEASGAAIPGMYRDARGVLYHPHLRQDIALGTLAVEQYERPAWTFNKILYSEKEGFFEILKADGWPERHDCALLTSKGYASRAARDLLDLLGETGEDLQFFCIHDADAAGTKIFESLQEGTAARSGRKVRIVNLGLEPSEALDMSLQVENVKRKKRSPVASYVSQSWAEWLQKHRVELNAMSSPQFIAWLDEKMAAHGGGKVVPPELVLGQAAERQIKTNVRQRETDRILGEAGIDEIVEREAGTLMPRLPGNLAAVVNRELGARSTDPWSAPLERLAAELVWPTDSAPQSGGDC